MARVSEYFGSNVFNDNVMKEKLPHETYKLLQRTIKQGKHLELGLANKYVRYVLLILTGAFHVPGFIIGNTLFLMYLSHINTLSTPYLWPFLPFSPKALWRIIIRSPVPASHLRPRILHPIDRKK